MLPLMFFYDFKSTGGSQWRSQPNPDARAQIFYSQRNYMSRRWAHFHEGPKNHVRTV